jgi:Sulfotransferase family
VTIYTYVTSSGHSGSTLLDMLIGSHSQVASLGELNQLGKNLALNERCSCGETIRSCRLWKQVAEIVGTQIGADLISDPYKLHLGYPIASTIVDRSRQTPGYLLKRKFILAMHYLQLRDGLDWMSPILKSTVTGTRNSVRLYEAVSKVLDVDVVVDSSKSYLSAINLYRLFPQQTRIVLLTRDGRAVLWSNLKRGLSRDKCVRDWRNRYERSVPLIRRHVPGSQWLHLRYEDLMTDTARELQSVCRLLGLPFEPAMLQFREKIHHIVNGNRMRLASSSTIALDEEWRDRLPKSDREYFEAQAGVMNRSLGYT